MRAVLRVKNRVRARITCGSRGSTIRACFSALSRARRRSCISLLPLIVWLGGTGHRPPLSAPRRFDKQSSVERQWIEYHRLLGVEHFYIYDNNSEDAILPRLRRYMAAGIVTYVNWPFRPDKGMHWNQVRPLARPSRSLLGPTART